MSQIGSRCAEDYKDEYLDWHCPHASSDPCDRTAAFKKLCDKVSRGIYLLDWAAVKRIERPPIQPQEFGAKAVSDKIRTSSN